MVKKTGKAVHNQQLRNQRLLNSWTQSQVAEKVGTTVVNVSRWENGSTAPSLYYRQKLCELFGKSADELGLLSAEEKLELTPAAPLVLHTLWNVPFRRNPFFTGREEVLRRLHSALEEEKVAAVAQTQAISGLGGIGKTQTAVEYAYRHQARYQAVFWAKADSRELLTADYMNLATLLNLPEKDEQDQNRVVAGVKRWLKDHVDWLLILDNTEDLELASDFLPPSSQGHVLLTTRAQSTGTVAQRIELERMGPEEGALFLLRRAKRIASDASFEQATPADRATALELSQTMEGLPLALDQAAAYIEETDCGLTGYLSRYRTRRAKLLSLRGESIADHPQSVATTWSLSFEKVQQANQAAADLLRLCAFLHPDAIPEEIFTEGAREMGATLAQVAADPLELDAIIRELRKYSLVKRDPEAQMLMIHRLVQEVLKDGMDKETQHQWAERAVKAGNSAFPEVDVANWSRCQRCLPQAQTSAELIAQWNIAIPEAARLLDRAGTYLVERGGYTQAEPLLKRALTIREQTLGLDHPDTATTLHNLARLYRYQGQYSQAEPLYLRALAIRERALGFDHPETAITLENLALFYMAQGQYSQAEALLNRTLAIKERVFGPNHPDTADTLDYLAQLYQDQGKYAQAEPLFLRTLTITEQTLGHDHIYTAATSNNLAHLYDLQGKYTQAEPLYHCAHVAEKTLPQGRGVTGVT